jgi:DNA-binding transcriptional ArsR family regulator
VQERASNGQLLSAERRQAILAILSRDGKVVAAQLVRDLGVSEDTIRRDLRELASQGLVHRVHGGALAPAPQPGSFARRSETCTAEKAALARAAVAVLGEARVVLIDGSTTNLEVARRLPAEPVRTILTNSPPIAAALAEHPSAEVVMIGGRRDRLHPRGARRRLRARRVRAAPRVRALDRRSRGGAGQAGDGGGLGGRDRPGDVGQAQRRQPVPRRAGGGADARRRRG